MKKLDAIKSQLAQRLGEAAMQSSETLSADLKTPITKQSRKTNSEAADTAANDRTTLKLASSLSNHNATGIVKLSVSLYNYDIECLDRIREFMRSRGVRNLTDSEALRLACRAVNINEQFDEIYQAMQKEDKRRRTD